MMFLPSDHCCRLKDQEYFELVFENGQILAKSQRSNVFMQKQRTISIMDLYEIEYNEDFMKSIHGGRGGESIKNLEDTHVVPEHHVVAADETNMLESKKHIDESTLVGTLKASSSKMMENQKNSEFIPPDEQSVVAERSVEFGFTYSSTDFSDDSEESTYLSSSLDDKSDEDVRLPVPARTRKALVKRKQSAEINKKLRTLQDLLPNSHEDDHESLLDEAINYMTTLQHIVQMMTMCNRFVTPSMLLHYSQMGLATGMQLGVPQFLPGTVPGAVLPEISAALPNQIPNSTSCSNLDEQMKSTE